jgi:4-hydroxy-3-polyprenylbenzoate decarboxylase/2,5-furandicarboxylate decarboxylase 2
VTGASGSIYGLRLLQSLAGVDGVETHLVVSAAGFLTASSELKVSRKDLEAYATVSYSDKDIGAAIASGSFRTDGMIIAPCSMKTAAGIATGMAGTLVARAADVVLKERRRLVALVHLRNMTAITEMGGIVFPPVPAFYNQPQTIDDIVDHTVGRVLDLFDIDNELVTPWRGLNNNNDND